MDNEGILVHQAFEEQQDMTAVERFAFKHDFHQLPSGAGPYQELIPKTMPGPGQQYAFEVNLDQCTGCKACVTACHNENGLEEDETWRSVGLIHGVGADGPVIQHVTGACHHCLDPACMNGCPVKAYTKDLATGVVEHLRDQCIGCQYCIFKCPYDVPKYNKKKGIVHKCDMCISRLKVGQAPACVRACPNEAIRITLVDTAVVRQDPSEFVRIPQAPDSRYTLPTTRYVTDKRLTPDMTSMDAAVFEPEGPHMPLVVMLVLTQLSVGAFFVEGLVNHTLQDGLRALLMPVHVLAGLAFGLLALGASIFHLGRPLYAFRALLGLKTSWLSREILAFGVFAFLAFVYAVQIKYAPAGFFMREDILAGAVLASGSFAVFASVMVYRDTHRVLWDTPMTTFKFFMTAVLLGTVTVMAVSLGVCAVDSPQNFVNVLRAVGIPLAGVMAALALVKIIVEASLFSHLRDPRMTPLKKSAMLMSGPLRPWTTQRFIYGTVGGVVLPLLFLAMKDYLTSSWVLAWVGVMAVMTAAGEIMERYLFFRAVVPLKMPH
ncbi:MAG: dimethyl sulfoxide reductase anchor subunit [Candidatus Omnitrophica bacterium]|nr:dimethyl sulfoxide reductase anchor subunit [Candidatus Omnitrophota bacterium]